jgi:hypothetical protein
MFDNLSKWFSRRLTAGAAGVTLLLTPDVVPSERVWPFTILVGLVLVGLTIVDAIKASRGEKNE